MKYKMFGIPNCDTVKKARMFLDKKSVGYEFIDFKKSPPKVDDIKRWEKHFGDLPANKKGPTFRKIKEKYESATYKERVEMLLENTSAIKRPILEVNNKIYFGFDEDVYKKL